MVYTTSKSRGRPCPFMTWNAMGGIERFLASCAAAGTRPPPKLAFTASLIALTAAACQQNRDAPSTPSTQTRDSAGIEIVENPRPAHGSRLGWVAPEPSLTIGTREGDTPYLLFRVRDAMRLPDGRFVVADQGSNELRVFDASGIHTATWSRKGEGPGEFTQLAGIAPWPGDSLLAWNARPPGFTVFDPRGSVGRTFALPRADRVTFAAPLGLGGIIAYRVRSGTASRSVNTELAEYEIRNGEGDRSATLGVFPGRRYYSASMLDSEVTMLHPFSPSIAAASWGELVVVAPTRTYEIRAFAADGTLRRIVRRDHTPIHPTPAYREAFFREFLRERGFSPEVASSEEEALEQVRQTMGEIPLPETLPAFATVLTDAIDHLWVREFTILDGEFEIPGQETSAGPVWTVFDPHGHVLGFVETPPGLLIYEIGADYILGHETDEDGIEYVQLWPLSRTRPDR